MLYAAFSPRAFRLPAMTMFLVDSHGRTIPTSVKPGCIYAREDGSEVLVTAVSPTPEGHAAYLAAWDDTEDCGIVTTWIRSASGASITP